MCGTAGDDRHGFACACQAGAAIGGDVPARREDDPRRDRHQAVGRRAGLPARPRQARQAVRRGLADPPRTRRHQDAHNGRSDGAGPRQRPTLDAAAPAARHADRDLAHRGSGRQQRPRRHQGRAEVAEVARGDAPWPAAGSGGDCAPGHDSPRLLARSRPDQAGRRLHAHSQGAERHRRDDRDLADRSRQAQWAECKLLATAQGHDGDDDPRRRQACGPGLRHGQMSGRPAANGKQSGTVLLVEDEHSIGSMTRGYLERSGWRVVWVRSGEEALAELGRHQIRIVILDIRLPGIDGFDVARLVRSRSDVPILMLTARDEEPDRVAGLELGADDYLTKPFSPRELVARMKAVLRRTDGRRVEDVLTLEDVVLDRNAREVSVEGRAVELTTKEFDLLAMLIENPGVVVSRDQLLDRVWGMTYPGGTRTVDVHVAQLRRKLGKPELIRTVRGAGYKTVRP